MPYFEFVWTDEIVAHLAEHDISPDDFERVVMNPERVGKSRSSGNPAAWGYSQDGRYIIAVYEKIDFATVVPVTVRTKFLSLANEVNHADEETTADRE